MLFKVCITGSFTEKCGEFILIQLLPETCLPGGGRHLHLFCLCTERVPTQCQALTALCVHHPPTHLQEV